MEADILKVVLTQFGAAAVFVLLALRQGWIVLGRDVRKMERADKEAIAKAEAREKAAIQHCEVELANAHRSFDQARDDFIARIKWLEESDAVYRDQTMELNRALVKSLDIAQAVVHA